MEETCKFGGTIDAGEIRTAGIYGAHGDSASGSGIYFLASICVWRDSHSNVKVELAHP